MATSMQKGGGGGVGKTTIQRNDVTMGNFIVVLN